MNKIKTKRLGLIWTRGCEETIDFKEQKDDYVLFKNI